MRGWLGDMARTAVAFWYWNVRKSAYVLRGRRGQCPCHNPSDSGRPFETGCEAVLSWNRPERFRRVCPLLQKNAQGNWVCSVSREGVRPFWGRMIFFYGGTTVAGMAAAGLVVFGGLRAIGYRPTPRQIFWPPAWRELKEVRTQFFVDKAEALLAKGQTREAVLSLSTAYDMNPDNYAIGMIIAQIYVGWRPDLVDGVYQRLYQRHPEHRGDTSRAWLRSLLARGDLPGAAALAHRQLAERQTEPAVWAHAVIEIARMLRKPELLEPTAQETFPAAVQTEFSLEEQMLQLPADRAAKQVLAMPVTQDFAYGYFHRVDCLIRLGRGKEALALLNQVKGVLTPRDVVRLALAGYAVSGDRTALKRETAAFLVTNGADEGAGALALLGLHLIKYPDADLLKMAIEETQKLPAASLAKRADAVLAVYFAAVFAGADEALPQLRNQLSLAKRSNPVVLGRVQDLIAQHRTDWPVRALLAAVQPMSLELNYALLEKYYSLQQTGAAALTR